MPSQTENPFNPLPKKEDISIEVTAKLIEKVASKELAARYLKIQGGIEKDKLRPKHLSKEEILANAQKVVDAANEALKLAQPEVERATTEASLLADMASYQAKGLTDWSEEVKTLITRWNELPQSERDYLINKRKEGFLIIGMPSVQTQLKTIQQAIDKLIPIYTNPDTGNREPANPTKIFWDYAKELINNQDPSLIHNTPNHPYFLTVEPTDRPPTDSCSKTIAEQIEWIAEQHTSDPHLFSINLLEYITLQVRNTENGKEPIDENTWTRFVGVPQHDGGVLYAFWYPYSGDRRLGVGGDGDGARARGGVRVAGRV